MTQQHNTAPTYFDDAELFGDGPQTVGGAHNKGVYHVIAFTMGEIIPKDKDKESFEVLEMQLLSDKNKAWVTKRYTGYPEDDKETVFIFGQVGQLYQRFKMLGEGLMNVTEGDTLHDRLAGNFDASYKGLTVRLGTFENYRTVDPRGKESDEQWAWKNPIDFPVEVIGRLSDEELEEYRNTLFSEDEDEGEDGESEQDSDDPEVVAAIRFIQSNFDGLKVDRLKRRAGIESALKPVKDNLDEILETMESDGIISIEDGVIHVGA